MGRILLTLGLSLACAPLFAAPAPVALLAIEGGIGPERAQAAA